MGSTALYMKHLSHLSLLKEKKQARIQEVVHLQVIIPSSSEIPNRKIALKNKMKYLSQFYKIFLIALANPKKILNKSMCECICCRFLRVL